MQSFVVACTNCGQRLEVDKEMLGQDVECPMCKASITLPSSLDLPTQPIPPVDAPIINQEAIPNPSEVESSKKDNRLSVASLRAFRKTLATNSTMNLNMANKDLSSRLHAEASRIRVMLDS